MTGRNPLIPYASQFFPNYSLIEISKIHFRICRERKFVEVWVVPFGKRLRNFTKCIYVCMYAYIYI